MAERNEMKLRIWKSCWELPSIDPECLSVIAYAKFTKAPLVLEETVPSKTVTEMLPELQVEESVYTTTLNILGILRREGHNADFNLNSIDHGDTLAYIALIEEKLRPGLLYNLWVDSGNYVNCTRPAYCKSFGFFRSYWDLPQMRSKIEIDLHCRGAGTSVERETAFYKEAKTCITLLSNRLGGNDFFFGSSPTTLDAVAFGYLSVLLKAPLASTQLKNHLVACDNLSKYCARIMLKYFKDTDTGPTYPKVEKTETKTHVNERQNQIISVSVALAAMLIYSVVMGIFTRGRGRPCRAALIDADDVLD